MNKQPVGEFLTEQPRPGESFGIRERFLDQAARLALSCVQLDADIAANNFTADMTEVRSKAFPFYPNSRQWIEERLGEPGFTGFLLYRGSQPIGIQTAYEESFEDLRPELKHAISWQAEDSRQWPVLRSSSLGIHPDYRNRGLAIGLRLIFLDQAAQRFRRSGGFVISRIKTGNIGSEWSASLVGHKPVQMQGYDKGEGFDIFRYYMSTFYPEPFPPPALSSTKENRGRN